MSVPKRDHQQSFFDVEFLLDGFFDDDNRYRLFREMILPALDEVRSELASMYCAENGRNCVEPVIVAGVTLLQFMDKVPDTKAIERLRLDLGWKYALGVALPYKGFDPTTLVHFRQRLVEHEKESLIFDAILGTLREAGLVRKRSKQRLDSTHVLGVVSSMSRLEVVRETLRLSLEMVEKEGMAGALPDWGVLIERYRDCTIDWRRQTKEQLGGKMAQAGQDALALIKWLRAQPSALRDHDKALLLERVFLEQFELTADGPDARAREASKTVKNPHDPDAEWAAKDAKKTKVWTGYKAHVAESVDEEGKAKTKGEPTEQFLLDVTTTTATTSDLEGRKQVLEAEQQRGLAKPQTEFVDGAYVSGETLAEAEEEGREVVGPARPSPERKGTFGTDQFDVDVAKRQAVCPAGKTSTQCSHIHDAHQGTEYYRFEWGAQCDDCPLRASCTNSKTGRRILSVGPHHDLVQARRREMKTEAFQRRMHQRNAIEGTISELVRLGMRRSRYRGLTKTRLANYTLGAACNANRWLRLVAWCRKHARKAG
jgi:transposase